MCSSVAICATRIYELKTERKVDVCASESLFVTWNDFGLEVGRVREIRVSGRRHSQTLNSLVSLYEHFVRQGCVVRIR